MSSRWRWSILAVVVAASLLLGTATALADPVRIPDNSLFLGTGSDGGNVVLRAPSATMLDFTYDFGAPIPGCRTVFASRFPLAPDGMSFGSANLRGPYLANVHITGVVDPTQARTIAGLTMADGAGPGDCTIYRTTWLATRQGLVTSAPALSRPNALYGGTATVFGQSGTGTVEFTTDGSGRLSSISFDVTQGRCSYRASSGVIDPPVPFEGLGVQYVAPEWTTALVVNASGANGVAVLVASGCRHVPVVFSTGAPVARATVATPTPTAPVSPTSPAAAKPALFTPMPAPGAWSTLSVVFVGGRPIDLEQAARDAGAAGVWVQDATGAFQLLVVGAPPFLRESFERAFPLNIQGPVAVTLTRQ
jgi:hypothetical protein